jgi:DNA-directed RNA polymerase specialized sigma24 family protein
VEAAQATRPHEEERAATGQRLRMSEGAVRVTLHRALKRLTAMAEGSWR